MLDYSIYKVVNGSLVFSNVLWANDLQEVRDTLNMWVKEEAQLHDLDCNARRYVVKFGDTVVLDDLFMYSI